MYRDHEIDTKLKQYAVNITLFFLAFRSSLLLDKSTTPEVEGSSPLRVGLRIYVGYLYPVVEGLRTCNVIPLTAQRTASAPVTSAYGATVGFRTPRM